MGDHEHANHEHRGSKAQPLCMNADTRARARTRTHTHTDLYIYAF
jgi:hypothetical protein